MKIVLFPNYKCIELFSMTLKKFYFTMIAVHLSIHESCEIYIPLTNKINY